MGSPTVIDYGENNGVRLYRICGSKEDVYGVLEDAREQGYKFDDTPIVNHVYRGQWTTVLKLKVAELEKSSSRNNT